MTRARLNRLRQGANAPTGLLSPPPFSVAKVLNGATRGRLSPACSVNAAKNNHAIKQDPTCAREWGKRCVNKLGKASLKWVIGAGMHQQQFDTRRPVERANDGWTVSSTDSNVYRQSKLRRFVGEVVVIVDSQSEI